MLAPEELLGSKEWFGGNMQNESLMKIDEN